MKNLVLIAFSALILSSCSKKDNSVVPEQSFHDANGTYINFTDIQWYVTKNGSFANVNLKIAGITNGNKVIITTSGDGLLTDSPIALTSGKFTMDGGISFQANAPASGTMQGSTQITVYKGTDKLVVHLVSDDIPY